MYSEEAAFTERSVRRNGASEFFTSNDDVFNNTVRIAVNDKRIGRIYLPDIVSFSQQTAFGFTQIFHLFFGRVFAGIAAGPDG